MTASIAKASVAAGSDALALDPGNGDRCWLIYTISWETAAGDSTADAFAVELANNAENYAQSHYAGVKNTRYQEGSLPYEEYNPTYSNDAMFDQQPYQTFGNNNYVKLKATQRKYDPNGFFATRTGGFKYT